MYQENSDLKLRETDCIFLEQPIKEYMCDSKQLEIFLPKIMLITKVMLVIQEFKIQIACFSTYSTLNNLYTHKLNTDNSKQPFKWQMPANRGACAVCSCNYLRFLLSFAFIGLVKKGGKPKEQK